ncbi:WD40-repeat-containing domain protein, partial [Dichomitus squalens]
LGHDTSVSTLVTSPNSNWLATGCEDGTIILWDNRENRILRQWAFGAPIAFLEFSSDSKRIASPRISAVDHEVAIRSVAECSLLALLSGHIMPVTTCAWFPDDIKIASVSAETIRVWDAGTYEQVYLIEDSFRIPSCAYVQFSPDGRWLQVASPDPRVTICRVWEADTGKPYRVFGHKQLVTTATFDPTSRLIATASDRGCVFLWKMKTTEWLEASLSQDQIHACSRLATIAFLQDGMQVSLRWIVLSTIMVQIWDPSGGDRLLSLEGHIASVLSFAFSPTRHTLHPALATGVCGYGDSTTVCALRSSLSTPSGLGTSSSLRTLRRCALAGGMRQLSFVVSVVSSLVEMRDA